MYIWMQRAGGSPELLESGVATLDEARTKANEYADGRSYFCSFFVTDTMTDVAINNPIYSIAGSGDDDYNPRRV